MRFEHNTGALKRCYTIPSSQSSTNYHFFLSLTPLSRLSFAGYFFVDKHIALCISLRGRESCTSGYPGSHVHRHRGFQLSPMDILKNLFKGIFAAIPITAYQEYVFLIREVFHEKLPMQSNYNNLILYSASQLASVFRNL